MSLSQQCCMHFSRVENSGKGVLRLQMVKNAQLFELLKSVLVFYYSLVLFL